MKKLLLFAVIVGGLAFTSCSKSGCECTISGVTTEYDDVDSDECDALDTSAQIIDGSCKTT